MLEVGKLYACEKFHLMFYPDQETAAAAARSHQPSSADPIGGLPFALAAHWSNRFGKPVSYAEKNIPLLVLKAEEKFYEVMIEDKKGWIIYEDWLEIKEIDNV